jgi:hypothetical protein
VMMNSAGSRMNSEGTQPTHRASDQSSPRIARREMSRRREDGLPRIVTLGLVAAFVLLLIVLAVGLPLSAYAYFQLSGLAVPGVHVGQLDMGGMNWQDVNDGLSVVYGQEQEILVTDGERGWRAKASDFGVGWDIDAATQEALNVGHGKDFVTEFSEMFQSALHGWEIEPALAFDRDAARLQLILMENTVNIPATDAELQIADGEVLVTESVQGSALDVDATLALLSEDPQALLLGGELRLILKAQAPEIADVSQAASEAERLLSSAPVVQAYDPLSDEHYRWEIGREDIASWLIVEQDEDGPRVSLDEARLASYAEGIDASLAADQFLELEGIIDTLMSGLNGEQAEGEEPLRIYHPTTRYVVGQDETLLEIGWKLHFPYWMIMDANPYLYSSSLEAGDELIIPSRDDLLPLPVIASKRIVISISDQRLRTYEDGALLKEYIVSTGIDRSPTQPGIFQVQTHELNAYASVWDLYMPHFLGIYEAWPDFMNGIHGLPMLSSGRRLWADVLGRPASYGCIILTLEAAEDLYAWAEDGVVVEIFE